MGDTVDDLAMRWVLHRVRAGLVAPHTGRGQRSNLDRFRDAHGHNRGMRADRSVFARWLESIGDLSVNTRRVHTSTVRSFVRWAAAEGYVSVKALGLIPQVRGARAVPRALNGQQAAQLLVALPTQKKRVVCGLMLWCGLRCAEVAALKVEDLNEREGTMLVKGKGGHERVVCVPAEFAPILSSWLDMRRRVPGPLVPAHHGGHFRAGTISTDVAEWMRSAGVKVSSRDGRSAHALRHTAASDVLDRGASIRTVQEMLGHVHLASTAIYLRRAKLDDLRKAMGGRDYAA